MANPKVKALRSLAERLEKKAGSTPAGRGCLREVNRLRSAAEALENAAANRSPLDTPGAHIKKLADRARQFDLEVTASLNRAIDAYREGYADAQRRIDAKIDLKPDAFAAEIRATFRTLGQVEKGKLLGELIDANRGPELAALIRAPSILTGIGDDRRAAYEQALLGKHAPVELAELEALDALMEEVSTASATAGRFAKELTDPSEVAKIERAARDAEAAGSAFDQALG